MHRVRRDTRAFEAAGELAHEEHVHQLGATVGLEGAVVVRRLEVVEVDAAPREAVCVRRDDHDPRRRTGDELFAEQVRQQEVPEVVRLELRLVTVNRGAPFLEDHTRVVDEDVEPIVRRRELGHECAHRRERCEVERHHLGRVPAA